MLGRVDIICILHRQYFHLALLLQKHSLVSQGADAEPTYREAGHRRGGESAFRGCYAALRSQKSPPRLHGLVNGLLGGVKDPTAAQWAWRQVQGDPLFYCRSLHLDPGHE